MNNKKETLVLSGEIMPSKDGLSFDTTDINYLINGKQYFKESFSFKLKAPTKKKVNKFFSVFLDKNKKVTIKSSYSIFPEKPKDTVCVGQICINNNLQDIDEIEIQTVRPENNFWKYAVPVFLVLAVIYFISRI